MSWSWSFAWEILPRLLRGLGVTVLATALGMLLALVVGLFLALARRSGARLLAGVAGVWLQFVRSTPLLVQLFAVFYLLPRVGIELAPLTAGILTLGLHYATYTAEVYRSGIEGVPRGQWEAATALNMTRWQTYRHVVLPQALPPILPALANYLVAMLKDTPLLSAITVGEVLQQAQLVGKRSFRYLEPLTLVGVLYLLLSLLSGWAVARLERRLRARRAA